MTDDRYRIEIEGLRTSNRWATLGIIFLLIAAAGALVWAVDRYFGADGVRVTFIGVGILLIILAIYAMAIGLSAVFGRQAIAHHNNILRGLIDFQRADDYGEVARQVAGGITGVIRSGNTLDSRVLTTANQLARQQTSAILAANQRQHTADIDANWYSIPAAATFDEDIPDGWR
jgi:Na+-transporting methylmalonyl-CoA/oxaloacetate decarboxylase gamma subunit